MSISFDIHKRALSLINKYTTWRGTAIGMDVMKNFIPGKKMIWSSIQILFKIANFLKSIQIWFNQYQRSLNFVFWILQFLNFYNNLIFNDSIAFLRMWIFLIIHEVKFVFLSFNFQITEIDHNLNMYKQKKFILGNVKKIRI